jgi:hypothetical protein
VQLLETGGGLIGEDHAFGEEAVTEGIARGTGLPFRRDRTKGTRSVGAGSENAT